MVELTKDNLFMEVLKHYYHSVVMPTYQNSDLKEAVSSGVEKGNAGTLMFFDGKKVLGRIAKMLTTNLEESVVLDQTVKDSDALEKVLDFSSPCHDSDLVYTYNSEEQKMTGLKASLLNGHILNYFGIGKNYVNNLLKEMLPEDFISPDYKANPVTRSGNRTKIAVTTLNRFRVNPFGKDKVRAIMIKDSVYNPKIGEGGLTGKVVELSSKGIVQEAYFYKEDASESSSSSPPVIPGSDIKCVLKTYAPSKKGPVCTGTSYLSFENDDYKLTPTKISQQAYAPLTTPRRTYQPAVTAA